MAEFVEPLRKAFTRFQRLTARVVLAGTARPEASAAAMIDYLRVFGFTILATDGRARPRPALPSSKAAIRWLLRCPDGDGTLLMQSLLP
ncbi:hypothetical protein [Mesorhizobium amorphae]|uniref:hypothetical protein n=1 Tax=Mesorhizobium amorphae TaxID=71433 RepID=UPI003D0CF629